MAAAVLVIASLPIALTLLGGGADWQVGEGWTLSWYPGSSDRGPIVAMLSRLGTGAGLAWLLLAVGLVLVVSPGRAAAQRSRVLIGAGLAAGLLAVLVLWTGGGALGPISLHRPDPCAWLAVALVTLGLLRGARPPGSAAGSVGWTLATLVLGLALHGLVVHADRSALATSLDPAIARAVAGSDGADRPPDVLWIVVDTLRADAIGAYHGRAGAADDSSSPDASRDAFAPDRSEVPRTPFLDALAASGLVVEEVRAPAPWTLPSMAGVMTARWPSTLDPEGRGRARTPQALVGLPAAVPGWIGRLREAGYYTAAFQKNPFLQPGSGFERDFDLYRMVGGDRAELDSAEQLVRGVHRWADVVAEAGLVAGAAGRPPWLLYVHFMDPHVDYRAPLAWRSEAARGASSALDGSARALHRRLAAGPPLDPAELAQLKRLYAAEVAYLDSALERLVVGLRARGVLDDATLVVVSADHGEQLGEHGGFEHGDLHRENVAVPFLLAGAGLGPGRIRGTASLIDLGPTVLDVVGVAPDAEAEGRSLFSSGSADVADDARPGGRAATVFSEYGERLRVEQADWVLLIDGPDAARLFDREADPGERVDVASRHPEVVARLRAEATRHRERPVRRAESPAWSLDHRSREALRALGYGD